MTSMQTRRLVTDWLGVQKRRTVWHAQVKIGTQPGTVALFLHDPVVGKMNELIDIAEDPGSIAHRPARRVLIERYDEVIDRWFVGRM